MLSGGIFTKSSMRPAQAGRIINTWVGDPHKILMLEAVSQCRLAEKCKRIPRHL